MSRPRSLPALATAAAIVLASRSAMATDCAYWSGNGPSVYNLQNGLTEAYAGYVDQAGLGGLRLDFRIDTETTWDQALFDQYDAFLAVAREHGLEVMGLIANEATTEGQASWNSGYEDGGADPGYGPYVQLFVDTAQTLFSRYGGQIKYWEIWNEPNACTTCDSDAGPTKAGGTYILPLVYSKMIAEVFVQAQSTITSDGLHLVAGGLFAQDIGGSFSPATDYAAEVYALGPWDWLQASYGRRYPWDAFGYHLYIDQGGATTSAHLTQYLEAIEQLEAQNSDTSPLWITEFGWRSPAYVTDAQQASNIDTALTLFESRSEVGRTFVFKVDDYDDYGIFDTSWNPKPAVATYQAHDTGCTHLPRQPLDAGTDAAADAGAKDAGAPEAGADASERRSDAGARRDATLDARALEAGGRDATGKTKDTGVEHVVDARVARTGDAERADAAAGGGASSGCGCHVAAMRRTPLTWPWLLAVLGFLRAWRAWCSRRPIDQ